MEEKILSLTYNVDKYGFVKRFFQLCVCVFGWGGGAVVVVMV